MDHDFKKVHFDMDYDFKKAYFDMDRDFQKKGHFDRIDIIIQDRVHSLFNHKITRGNPHRFKTWVCAFIFQAVLNFIYMKL